MQVRELAITDTYEFVPPTYSDHRGLFVAPYQEAPFHAATGRTLHVAQSNHSISARGVVRGVHFAETPPGQAKYVYCPRGALLDVVVDVRTGSPTFGGWDAVRLDEQNLHAVYISEGIGHVFMALSDDTVLAYLCSTPYNPGIEHAINPLDEQLELPWPADVTLQLSAKDRQAPTLKEAADADLLPSYDDCRRHYERMRLNSCAR